MLAWMPARLPFFTIITLSTRSSELVASILGLPVTTSARTVPAPWLENVARAPLLSVSEAKFTTVPVDGLIVSAAEAPVTVTAGRSAPGSAVIVALPVTVSALVAAFQLAAVPAALSHDGRLMVHESLASRARAL